MTKKQCLSINFLESAKPGLFCLVSFFSHDPNLTKNAESVGGVLRTQTQSSRLVDEDLSMAAPKRSIFMHGFLSVFNMGLHQCDQIKIAKCL